MKINSRFVDYYDFISRQFGKDPDVVYLRYPFSSNKLYRERIVIDSLRDSDRWFQGNRWLKNTNKCVVYIVAGSYVFNFLETTKRADSYADAFVPYSDTYSYEIISEKHDNLFYDHKKKEEIFPAIPADRLNELIRLVGMPVFKINRVRNGSIILDDNIPILKDFGIPSIVPAEQMWQSIYTTLTSVLRSNPDKEPPVVLGNDDRIHAAGFDLKSSFRHPVNPKKIK